MDVFPEERGLRAGLDRQAKTEWEKLHTLRAEVLQDLERGRAQKFINGSLEAKKRLRSKGPRLELMERHAKDLPGLFIVSQVVVLPFDGPVHGEHPEPFHVEVLRSDGIKCERCWNYSTHVGENARCPAVCERCSKALAEIERSEPSLS